MAPNPRLMKDPPPPRRRPTADTMERGKLNRPKAMKDGIPPDRLNDIKVAAAKKKAVAKKAAPAKKAAAPRSTTRPPSDKYDTTRSPGQTRVVRKEPGLVGSLMGGRPRPRTASPAGSGNVANYKPKKAYPNPGLPMGRPASAGRPTPRPVYDSRYRRMPTNGRSPMQMMRPMLPRTY